MKFSGFIDLESRLRRAEALVYCRSLQIESEECDSCSCDDNKNQKKEDTTQDDNRLSKKDSAGVKSARDGDKEDEDRTFEAAEADESKLIEKPDEKILEHAENGCACQHTCTVAPEGD